MWQIAGSTVVVYCTREDLANRLSSMGLITVADDDADGVVSESEQQASLDQAIAAAAAEIDAALAPHVPIPLTEANEWLKHRAIDLAAEHLAERKGAAVPTSLRDAATRSRNWLESVRTGQLRVPRLAYPADEQSSQVRQLGLPRVVNPVPHSQGDDC